MSNIFYPNESPVLTVTFRNHAGAPVEDMTVVEFVLVPPGVTDPEQYLTYRHGVAPEVTKPVGTVGTFQFQRVFTEADAGNWTWQAQGDAIAQAYGSFTVATNPLDLPPPGADQLAYLSLDAARQRYNRLGLGAISDGEMVDILLDAEAMLDDWLGWRAAPMIYEEVLTSGRTGRVLLPQAPVIDILAIELMPDRHFPAPQPALTPTEIAACWMPGESWFASHWPGYPIRVRWRAGLDPLPRAFAMAVWALLQRSADKGMFGDLAAVQAPAQHVTMLTLPGGLSKQYATPAQSRSQAEKTELDQIWLPSLGRYRREFVV